MPNSIFGINWTPLSEWYVVRCGFKNGHIKDTCLEEIGLRAQNLIIIMGSIVNIIEGGRVLYANYKTQ